MGIYLPEEREPKSILPYGILKNENRSPFSPMGIFFLKNKHQ